MRERERVHGKEEKEKKEGSKWKRKEGRKESSNKRTVWSS